MKFDNWKAALVAILVIAAGVVFAQVAGPKVVSAVQGNSPKK